METGGGFGQKSQRSNGGKWKSWIRRESERSGASGRKEMSQMEVTRSHIKDALKKCPINGTWSQEKNGPLEYAIKFRGSLTDNFTTKDLEPTGILAERCGQRKILIPLGPSNLPKASAAIDFSHQRRFCTHLIKNWRLTSYRSGKQQAKQKQWASARCAKCKTDDDF